jgi:hypothetical protein
MKNIENAYKGFTTKDTFSYYDDTHPLDIIIGINEFGQESVLIRSEFPPKPKITKTSSIDISLSRYGEKYQLGFHLRDKQMNTIFYKFVDDLVESSRGVTYEKGMDKICDRYELWKKLFFRGKQDLLSESQIIGLIGELLFLKDVMFFKYTTIEAINSWSGCDNTHKDFSINNDWYEIKVTRIGSLTVKISSLNQLDSITPGYLVIYEFEKMSESFNGLTLNTVVNNVLSLLSNELQDKLIEKLKNAGYSYNDKYDEYSYRFAGVNNYFVDRKFPKISRFDIPSAIVRIEYEILKNDLSDYLVGDLVNG